jgi:low temperature requirement protein LtrA
MLGTPTFRLEPPRLRTIEDPGAERHATWFELYFDLVFAAAVIELATGLAKDPSGAVFARFFGLFAAVSWAWTGFTVYANRFDTDDLVYRLMKGAAGLTVAAMAVEIPRLLAGDGGTVEFAAGYAIVRFLLVGLYIRAWFHVRGEGRRLVDSYIVAFSFTATLWAVSIMVPEPYRFVLWGLALGLDLCVPPFSWGILGGVPIVVSHVTERFGQFFIVVLGQSVASVVGAVAGFHFGLDARVIATACFVTALAMWWIYFDLADTSVVARGRLALIYLYGHFLLFPGVAAFAAGATLAITHADHPALEAGPRWALAGGLAAVVLSLSVIHLGAEWTSTRDRTFLGRMALIGLLVTLATAGGGIDPLVFVLVTAIAMVGQLLLEAFTFPTGAASILDSPTPATDSPG